jgi:hypothetical protein
MKNLLLLLLSFLLNLPIFAQSTEGLVAHYPLDGNALDMSGNNFSGTIYGASVATNRFNISGMATSFDGINDWIEIADNSLLRLNGDFTISCWIKVDVLSNPTAYSIVSKRTSIASDGYFIALNGFDHAPLEPGTVNFNASGGSDPSALSDMGITLGEWINILYEFDEQSGICNGYYNNELVVSSEINTLNENTTATFKIGKDGQSVNDFYFDGLIDDIRIYNRVLTEEERDEILNEDELSGTAGIEQEILCAGEASGEILFNVEGGSPGYLYSIDGGLTTQSSPSFQNLPAGEFDMEVIDEQETVLSLGTILLEEPSALSAEIEVVDNIISVTPTGGTGNYSYSINSEDFQDFPIFSGLPIGSYFVTVQDENGCEFISTELVLISSITDLRLHFSVYPNPAEDYIFLNIEEQNLVRKVKVVDFYGKMLIDTPYSFGIKISTTELQNGAYLLILEDDEGKLIGRNKFIKFAQIRA